MNVVELPPTPCPSCGELLDHTGQVADTGPSFGAAELRVTICLYCVNLLVLTPEYSHRLPTAREHAQLTALPEVRDALWIVANIRARM